MKRAEYLKFSAMGKLGEIADGDNPIYVLSLTWTSILVDVVAGKYDLNELACRELENRGMDASGKWVGFGRTVARSVSSHEQRLADGLVGLLQLRDGNPDATISVADCLKLFGFNKNGEV